MAYGNIYPTSYPMYQPQPVYQQPQAPAQAQGGLNWVQGEAGARSYHVAPNTTVDLWDSESQTIYLKSADGSGMPSMKILDYTIRDINKPTTNSADNIAIYATKDQIEEINDQIKTIQNRLDKLMKKEEKE